MVVIKSGATYQASINRTIEELKLKNESGEMVWKNSINRTIEELKFLKKW